MNSLLLTIGFVLILALSALFAAPLFIDWNDYRRGFEEQASAVAGRSVSIRGDISVRILPAPEVRLEDVVLADASGSFDAPTVEFPALTATLSSGALLRGAIQATDLRLDAPLLRLAVAEDGLASWDGLGGAAPPRFVSGVALDQITIAKGRIAFEDARSGQALALTDIDGVMIVQGLAGPYRFTGQVSQGGIQRELRFSTGRAEESGRTTLKAVVEDPDAAMIYMLDGALTDWRSSPSLEGAFTARAVPEADAQATAKSEGEAAPVTAALPAAAPFEARAKLKATATALDFTDLDVTLRQQGRSQTLKGKALVDLTADMRIDGELAARFLDADLLFAAPGGGRIAPLDALSRTAGFLLENRQRAAIGRLAISVEQLNAGADLLRNVNVTFATGDDGLRIEAVSMEGPGGSVLSASGLLSGDAAAPQFAGPAELKGAQADTLLRWLSRDPAKAPRTEIGSFELAGDVAASAARVAVTDLNGLLDGAAFSGEVDFQPKNGNERGSLALKLKSDRLDLNRALADAVTLDELLETPAEQRAEDAAAVAPRAAGLLGALAGIDADVEIAFGAVALPGMAEGPLDAQFSYRDDTLDIARLSFNAAEAISINGQGRIEQLTAAPNGKADFALKAANQEAVKLLAETLGLPASVAENGRRLTALAPLDLVVGLEARRAGDVSNVNLTVGGSAADTNVALKGTFAGRFDAFAKGEIDGEATLTNPDARKLLKLLLPEAADARLERAGEGEAVLRITAKGVPDSGMETLASVHSQALSLRFEGDAKFADGWLALDGDAASSAADSVLLLALLDLPPPSEAGAPPFKLFAKIASESGVYQLSEVSGNLAGTTFQGTAKVDLSGARTALVLDGRATSVSLGALLGLSVAWDRNPATDDVVADLTGGAGSVWPSRAFALGDAAADLDIAVDVESIDLFDGVAANQGRIELALRPGSLQLTKLQGRVFGGDLTASGKLSAKGSAALLEGSLDLANAQLAPMGEALAGRVLAEGPVGLSFTLNGEGLSPSGLIAGLTGKGQVALGDGMLRNLSAQPLKDVAAQAARRDGGASAESLARDLGPRLTSGDFDFRPASIPFELKAGTVRLSDATLSTDGARADFRAYVELVSLRLDSEWNVSLSDGDVRNADMPPVNLVIAGPLAEGDRLRAIVATAAVERYFTMRRMEDDVEQLENLDVGGGNEEQKSDAPPPELQTPEAPEASAADPKVPDGPQSSEADRAVVPDETIEPAPQSAAVSPSPPNVENMSVAPEVSPEATAVPLEPAVLPPLPIDNPLRAVKAREAAPPVAARAAPALTPAAPETVAPGRPAAPRGAPEPGSDQLPWLAETELPPEVRSEEPRAQAIQPRAPVQRRRPVRRAPRPSPSGDFFNQFRPGGF